MSAIHRPRHHYDFADYLELRDRSNIRLEFWAGQIYAMAGGSPEHSRLSLRIGSLLDQRRPAGCAAFDSNLSVRPLSSDRATYADALLICGSLEYFPGDDKHRTITNPRVVVEVLSESTADDDQTDKFDHYRLAPTLEDYVLIFQNEHRVELRSRRVDGWLTQTFGPGERVCLACGIEFTVEELYAP